MNDQLDILFFITGNPLPAMLDMIFYAQSSGLNTAMVLLERGELDLQIDSSFVNFEIITIHVPYKSVDLKRFTSIPSIYSQLKRITKSRLKSDGLIVTASYDLLLFSYFICRKNKYRIRHQVRDLHTLQLSKTLKSWFFVKIEQLLLQRVESIIVSSPEFKEKYYKNIFNGDIILLENTPSKSTWAEFIKEKKDDVFRIGFIGILRYRTSLYQLIDAVEELAAKGAKIKVLFAGGGNNTDLKARIRNNNLFDFHGPYEYSKDIKQLFSNLDLIYSVYDSFDFNCKLAMPNKFYESIISQIPIVVAANTFVGSEVERIGIGKTVLSGDKDALIQLLSDVDKSPSWYEDAMTNLKSINPEYLYIAYEKALKKCILE